MSKLVKELITRELAQRYGGQRNAVWVELRGLDGITTNEFRRDLRAHQMRLEVVKTALLRRACAEGPFAALARQVQGPVALVTGGESAIDVARRLEEWRPKLPDKLRLRGALLEGEFLDEDQVQHLARMPGRRELQGRLAVAVLAPGGRIAGALVAPGGSLAGCLKTLIDRLEKGEPLAKAG